MDSPLDITDDEFELKGEWSIPENPEQRLFGILKYSKGTGTLELQGVFDRERESFFEPFDPEIILGKVPGLKGVTLSDCHLLRSDGRNSTFTTHLIFTNHIYENSSQINFKKCTIHFRYLEQWVLQSAIKFTFDDNGYDLKAEVKRPEPISVKISPELTVLITSSYDTGNLRENFSKFVIKQKKFFRIESTKNLTFNELKKIITKLQNFLSFAIDEPTHCVQIIGYPDGDDSGLNYRENAVGIFYDSITSRLIPERDIIRDSKMLFNYRRIADDFETILQNWFRISDTYEQIIRSISALKNNPHMYLEEIFTYYAQSFESYHEINTEYENKQMNSDGYHDRIKLILDSIEDKEIQSWLENKLSASHANNKSFFERIVELIKNHPTFINEPNDEKIIEFAKKIRNMRNTLVHQKDRGTDYVDDLMALIFPTKILMESIILSELGFGAELLTEIVKKRKKWYRIN